MSAEEQIALLGKIIEIMSDALNRIASWGEGPEVTGRSDFPHDAKIARDALQAAAAVQSDSPR